MYISEKKIKNFFDYINKVNNFAQFFFIIIKILLNYKIRLISLVNVLIFNV